MNNSNKGPPPQSQPKLLVALIRDWREAAKIRDQNGMNAARDYTAGRERGYSLALTACADSLEAALSRLPADKGDS